MELLSQPRICRLPRLPLPQPLHLPPFGRLRKGGLQQKAKGAMRAGNCRISFPNSFQIQGI
eukprot:3135273-Prorocentrum_lima.AAC.1